MSCGGRGGKAEQQRENSGLWPRCTLVGNIGEFEPYFLLEGKATSDDRQSFILWVSSFFFFFKTFKLCSFSNYLFKIISSELSVYIPLNVLLCASCTVCPLQRTWRNHANKDHAHFVLLTICVVCVCACVCVQIAQNLEIFFLLS